MDKTYEDYPIQLENKIKNIKINNKKYKQDNIKIHSNIKVNKINKTEETKDFYCKQLDSLNYCLEMHKVRQNKKADFDIYSTLEYNIEDENIGKNVVFSSWKELDDNIKNTLIEEFITELSETHNLDVKYTEEFVNANLNKIKYDKYNKKIVDLHGMIKCTNNNSSILKIKIKDKKNTNINKLRKSLSNLKKSHIK